MIALRRSTRLALGALLATAVAVTLLVVSGGTRATAAAPDCSGYPACVCPTLSVSTTTPAPGESVTASGTGFAAGERVTLVLVRVSDGKDYTPSRKVVRADAQGAFTAEVRMPEATTTRVRYDLVARTTSHTQACPVDPSTQLVLSVTGSSAGEPVTGVPAGSGGGAGGNSGPGSTAFTGLDLWLLVLAAAALLGVGAAAQHSGRRRRAVRVRR